MQISRISYRREDILHFKNVSSDINGLDIADHSLLYNLSLPTHNGSIVKQKTKRGNRAGKRRKYTKLHTKRPSINYSTLPKESLIISYLYLNIGHYRGHHYYLQSCTQTVVLSIHGN